MQKLTAEQAEWLIQKIQNKQLVLRNLDGSMNTLAYCLDIKEIINQCTEKEFPNFEMITNNYDDCYMGSIGVCLFQRENSIDENKYCLIKTDRMEPLLTFEAFKQFTAGCNEICKWIEGQE